MFFLLLCAVSPVATADMDYLVSANNEAMLLHQNNQLEIQDLRAEFRNALLRISYLESLKEMKPQCDCQAENTALDEVMATLKTLQTHMLFSEQQGRLVNIEDLSNRARKIMEKNQSDEKRRQVDGDRSDRSAILNCTVEESKKDIAEVNEDEFVRDYLTLQKDPPSPLEFVLLDDDGSGFQEDQNLLPVSTSLERSVETRLVTLEAEFTASKANSEQQKVELVELRNRLSALSSSNAALFSSIHSLQALLAHLQSSFLHYGIRLSNVQAELRAGAAPTGLRSDAQDDAVAHAIQTMKSSLKSFATRRELSLVNKRMSKSEADVTRLWIAQNHTQINVELLLAALPELCTDDSGDGLQLIRPDTARPPVLVRCRTIDRQMWTVIQSRNQNDNTFNRPYTEYVDGFGAPSSAYWLGLDLQRAITAGGSTKLRIHIWTTAGEFYWAEYGRFYVGPQTDGYRLLVNRYRGNASDALHGHSGMRFSAFDTDQDSSSTHCARFYASGWWFAQCLQANLNGFAPLGIVWFDDKSGVWLHLDRTEMLVAPI